MVVFGFVVVLCEEEKCWREVMQRSVGEKCCREVSAKSVVREVL